MTHVPMRTAATTTIAPTTRHPTSALLIRCPPAPGRRNPAPCPSGLQESGLHGVRAHGSEKRRGPDGPGGVPVATRRGSRGRPPSAGALVLLDGEVEGAGSVRFALGGGHLEAEAAGGPLCERERPPLRGIGHPVADDGLADG